MYEIAIPSYQRDQTLKNKTLAVLEKYNISPKKVTIFVADENEHTKYYSMLKDTPYAKSELVIGVPGIGAVRNHICRYYDEGTKVFHMDDDLMEVLKKVDDKKMIPIDCLVHDVIEPGFAACKEHNANLFGIYAAANPMFMNHRVSVGLYYCIGSMWGNIIRHDDDLTLLLDDKEDFERSLQYYVKDGKICRLDNITVKSKYYKEPGGMQVERTPERVLKSAENLVERFPGLCTMYIRETTGHAELRLRDTRKKVVVEEHNIEQFFGE